MTDRIALTDLAAALADEGIQADYRRLYAMVLNGQLPGAKRLPNGRIAVDADTLPEVAKAYLTRHPSAVAA